MTQRMSDASDPFESRLGAGAFALLVVLCVLGGGKGIFAALVLGAVTFVMLSSMFQWLFCAPVPLLRPFAAQAIFMTQTKPNHVPTETVDQDFDGDGVVEGADEGVKPDLLQAPRNGQADNLKEIKGIGPKLEAVCHSVGVFHFDQIAAWNDDEVAWVNANLIGFKGRVTRDNWVEQAKTLAVGGATAFSQKVGKGDVY